MTSRKSNFVKEKIPLLLARYALCYHREDNCVEYFIKDFHLHIEGLKLCQSAEVCGDYPQLDIDVSLIKERVMEEGEVPFMV